MLLEFEITQNVNLLSVFLYILFYYILYTYPILNMHNLNI